MQVPTPPTLYWPAGQMAAVELVDPATQAYPAVHAPLHADVVSAGTAPNDPAGQITHTAAPAGLYWPAGQMAAVELVDPATHAYPAVHAFTHVGRVWPPTSPYRPPLQGPVHVATDSPVVEPYLPGGQGAVHAADVSAVVAPYVPAGHAMQTLDPAGLYCPMAHTAAVGDVDPATHA